MGRPRIQEQGKFTGPGNLRFVKAKDTPIPRFLEVHMDNGLPLKAPLEAWIVGILQALSPEQRRVMIEVVNRFAVVHIPPSVVVGE